MLQLQQVRSNSFHLQAGKYEAKICSSGAKAAPSHHLLVGTTTIAAGEVGLTRAKQMLPLIATDWQQKLSS